MLFYEREVEQRENGTQNTSREFYTTPAAEAKNPSDVSPSNTDRYAAAVKRGSPFSTTSAVKPKPEIDSSTPKNNKAIPVHLRSTDKSHAKTFFPPAETWSSKSNYSKLPRTSKDGVPSFIPTPIRTASKISHSSLGNSTPVKLPAQIKGKPLQCQHLYPQHPASTEFLTPSRILRSPQIILSYHPPYRVRAQLTVLITLQHLHRSLL